MGKCYTNVVAEPFTNEIGQTINPGDEVVVVTTGYAHRVNVYTAKFLGVRRNKKTDEFVGTSVGDVPSTRTRIVYSSDGEYEEIKYGDYDWTTRQYPQIKTGRRYSFVREDVMTRRALYCNRIFKIGTQLADVRI